MTTSSSSSSNNPLLRQLFVLAQRAMQQGDVASAEQLCTSVLASDPAHLGALNFVVTRALDAGDADRARAVVKRALALAQTPELHFLHGRTLAALADREAAREAFARVVALDPQWLPALLWQAEQETALGLQTACVATSQQALRLAERMGVLESPERLPADIRQRISNAFDTVDRQRDSEVEAALAPVRARHGADAIASVEHAIDASYGKRPVEWTHPLQRPTFLLFPSLAPRAWFDRSEFPFLAEIERHTSAIRDELLALLADETQLSPYIDMSTDSPSAAVWQELNRSARWSSYHLFRHGERVEEHCARCPRTAAALEALPLMRIPDHSPEALFSILKPRTHIPPHTGVINGRLTVHLPLIVPPDCGALKAGDEAHGWEEGRCLVFDDSFVHEAWNSSDRDRVVLIFDVWDPRLSPAEREAISASIAAIGRFNRTYGGSDPTQNTH